MRTFRHKRAYTVSALLLSLVLLCGCAAPAAEVQPAPTASPTPPSTVPDTPAPTAAPEIVRAEKNGMYDLLGRVFDSYHAGAAGSSLTAALLSANMVDWAAENGLDAVEAGARAWDRGMETEFGESFLEKLLAVRRAGRSIAQGETGILSDCGYEGEWDHSAQEVEDCFDAVFAGLGVDAGTDAQPEGSGAVLFTVETEKETYYGSRQEDTVILYYSCARPEVYVPDADACAAINEALQEDVRLFVEGPAEEMEGVQPGRDGYLRAAEEELERRMEEGYADSFFPYSYERSVDLSRADEAVLSINYVDTTYQGGAHGYALHTARVFDTRTGASLRLEDLGADGGEFLTALEQRLFQVAESAEYGAYPYWDEYREILPTLLRDGNWYLSREGVVVMANPYEMDSYAAGLIEFTIPYEWLADTMKPEYLPGESAADGALDGEILPGDTDSAYRLDDGTDGQGAAVDFTARGRIENVTVRRVSYSEYTNSFWDEELLWYAGAMEDGEDLLILTWVPDAAPNLAISYTDAEGEKSFLISQSGKDGSLALMPRESFAQLPMEISQKLPFAWDIDGDGERETIDLRNDGPNGLVHWELLIDDTPVPTDSYAMGAEVFKLWLADLDYDGSAEIFFTGDMGSDDYVTCGWRGDSLESILFVGDTRYDRTGETTHTADGELTFSIGQPILRSFIYQMGTYDAFRPYSLQDGVMTPDAWREWSYRSNRFELEVVRELPVRWDDGEGVLPEGSRLTLTGTDGRSTRFVTDSGHTGTIDLEYRQDGNESGWFIAGVSENEYFAMLPYVG